MRGAAGAWNAPTTVYVGLFTNTSGNAATNLEANTKTDEVSISGTAYARQSVAFAAAASGSTTNSATITFPAATANWGTVTHIAILDNDTEGAGNVLFWGAVSASKQIDSGDTFQITAGNLTVTLS